MNIARNRPRVVVLVVAVAAAALAFAAYSAAAAKSVHADYWPHRDAVASTDVVSG